MKKTFALIGIVFLLAGCGRKGAGQTLDQQIMKLESEIQMLQQSVEIQSKTMKDLEGQIVQLRRQVSESNVHPQTIEILKKRIEMLEDSPDGFAK